MEGLLGRKLGMTQVFDENGQQVPVTVLAAGPCVVVRRKTEDKDGYDAVLLGFEDQKEHRVGKPMLGVFKKAGCTPKRQLREFSVDRDTEWKGGDVVTVAILAGASTVDVAGTTKGRGFQGVMRRHRMSGGPVSHGGHSKKRIGSIGQSSYPARVSKGKRMPGHMGHVRATQECLRVVQLREEDNVLLVEGSVPGPTGGVVAIRKCLKRRAKQV